MHDERMFSSLDRALNKSLSLATLQRIYEREQQKEVGGVEVPNNNVTLICDDTNHTIKFTYQNSKILLLFRTGAAGNIYRFGKDFFEMLMTQTEVEIQDVVSIFLKYYQVEPKKIRGKLIRVIQAIDSKILVAQQQSTFTLVIGRLPEDEKIISSFKLFFKLPTSASDDDQDLADD